MTDPAGRRATLAGIGLLLVGSFGAGLVVLVPAIPVPVGVVVGLVCLPLGLWLVVRQLGRRLQGLRLAVRSDPVLAEVVPSRFGPDAVRAWDLLVLAADGEDPDVERLRAAARQASDVDDLARRLDAS